MLFFNILTHFKPMLHFYTPWKRQKTRGFLTLSGGMEIEHWLIMGQRLVIDLKQECESQFSSMIKNFIHQKTWKWNQIFQVFLHNQSSIFFVVYETDLQHLLFAFNLLSLPHVAEIKSCFNIILMICTVTSRRALQTHWYVCMW